MSGRFREVPPKDVPLAARAMAAEAIDRAEFALGLRVKPTIVWVAPADADAGARVLRGPHGNVGGWVPWERDRWAGRAIQSWPGTPQLVPLIYLVLGRANHRTAAHEMVHIAQWLRGCTATAAEQEREARAVAERLYPRRAAHR